MCSSNFVSWTVFWYVPRTTHLMPACQVDLFSADVRLYTYITCIISQGAHLEPGHILSNRPHSFAIDIRCTQSILFLLPNVPVGSRRARSPSSVFLPAFFFSTASAPTSTAASP